MLLLASVQPLFAVEPEPGPMPEPDAETSFCRLELQERIWLSDPGGASCRLSVSMDFFPDECQRTGKGPDRPSFSGMNASISRIAFGLGEAEGRAFLSDAAAFRDKTAETYRKEAGAVYAEFPHSSSLDYFYRIEGRIIDTGVYFWTYRIDDTRFTGGAHPQKEARCLNFGSGGLLGLADVFGENAEERLIPVLMEALMAQEGVSDTAQLSGKSYFLDRFFASGDFYFEGGQVHFLYNPYQIAPYSKGLVEISVPVSTLRRMDLLKR